METRKAIMLIMDGLGDRPIRKYGSMTPLEAAYHPVMDELTRKGICGIMDPVAPGVRVGTDVGHLALFGYNPLKVYWGRGPIEAEGVNVDLKPGDIAFRCNFATVDDQMNIIDRRAGRIRQGTQELARVLNGMKLSQCAEVIFKEATEHRAVLVLRNRNLSPEVTASDPGAAHADEKVKVVKPRQQGFKYAQKTADLVNEFSQRAREILSKHPVNLERTKRGLLPANYILTRGAGMKLKMKSIADKFDIKGACIAGESTVLGIARMAGFDVFTDERFTANYDTDVEKKMEFVLHALRDYDLVVVHLKATDILSHDHKPSKKIKFIERVDEAFAPVYQEVKEKNVYIGFTADHSTSCELGYHCADPVPVFLWGRNVLSDDVHRFCERDCAKGGLHRINANEFLLTLLDYMGVTYRFGA